MARIGENSRLPAAGGRWQVRLGTIVIQSPPGGGGGPGGGLGFWWVQEVGAKAGQFPPYRFRVQRDAIKFAETMNLRAP